MPISCPYCRSTNVSNILDNASSMDDSLENTVFSPSVLAGLGASIAKSFNVNPFIGVVTGTVAGMAYNFMSNDLKDDGTSHYYCHNCQQSF